MFGAAGGGLVIFVFTILLAFIAVPADIIKYLFGLY